MNTQGLGSRAGSSGFVSKSYCSWICAFPQNSRTQRYLSLNGLAVAEPAKTIRFPGSATFTQPLLVPDPSRAGPVGSEAASGGRSRQQTLAWGSSNRGRVGGCPKLRIAGLVSQRFSPNTYEVSRPCPN